MEDVEISPDDPSRSEVLALLGRHLSFAREHTPPEDVHALDVDGLLDPSISFFSARIAGQLVGVGALKKLDGLRAEIKSMHTAEEARGRGVGRSLLDHLLVVAREDGFQRVSLETGATGAFAPARALYASAGFLECGPFAGYVSGRSSTFMTLVL